MVKIEGKHPFRYTDKKFPTQTMILQRQMPKPVSLGALLVLLVVTAITVVLPSLNSMQMIPGYYYSMLPVAYQGDIDNDGILDSYDATPYGAFEHAAAEEEVVTAE